jgi:hypothetical protein
MENAPIRSIDKMSRRTLNIVHWVAGTAHLAQAVAYTGLLATRKEPSSWPLTRWGFNRVHSTHQYDLAWLLPVFPLLSSLNHLVSVAAPDWYTGVLARKANSLRWTEYGVSAGVMTWLIGNLVGMSLRELIGLAIANTTLQMFGYLLEKRKAEGAPRSELMLLLIMAWTLFMAMWVPLLIGFITVTAASNPPPAVYTIVWALFALFASFGMLSAVHILTDRLDFVAVEIGYAALSLSSKTLLAGLVYGGVVRNREQVDTPDAAPKDARPALA